MDDEDWIRVDTEDDEEVEEFKDDDDMSDIFPSVWGILEWL